MSKSKFTTAPAMMACDSSRTTIDAAKEWLRNHTAKGGECPCCRQRVQFYNRPLTSSMAYVLILIDRYCRSHTDWLHVPSHLSSLGVGEAARGGDWAKMVHWGLITREPGGVRRDKSSRTGFWRTTDLGHAFVAGTASVRKHVLMYNKKPLPKEEQDPNPPLVSIRDSLGNRFDYEKLMAGGVR